MSSAVAYMHSLNFMHRDIKLLNILLDGTQCIAKLAGLNLAVTTERASSIITRGVDTFEYMAIEV